MSPILVLAYSMIAVSLTAVAICGVVFLKIQARDKKKLAELQEADTWIGELDSEAKELLQGN